MRQSGSKAGQISPGYAAPWAAPVPLKAVIEALIHFARHHDIILSCGHTTKITPAGIPQVTHYSIGKDVISVIKIESSARQGELIRRYR
jgi:hypothetical protein